jgi:hypothetical protein
MIENKRIMRLRKNKKGGIEGLPLQLMIIVLVAALGTAVIVGWVSSVDTPTSIGDVTVGSGDIDMNRETNGKISVSISVTDQNGDPLEGVLISLTGCGIRTSENGQVYGNSDRNGNVEFKDLTINSGSGVRFVNVSASKSGYGEDNTARIAVIS